MFIEFILLIFNALLIYQSKKKGSINIEPFLMIYTEAYLAGNNFVLTSPNPIL